MTLVCYSIIPKVLRTQGHAGFLVLIVSTVYFNGAMWGLGPLRLRGVGNLGICRVYNRTIGMLV